MIALKQIIKKVAGERISCHLYYRRHYRRLLNKLGYSRGPMKGEPDYLKQWRQLSFLVEPYSYRLYSNYCGQTPDIVPYDILHTIIEPTLNPPSLWAEYEDKNKFSEIVGSDILPCAIVSRMAGGQIKYHVALSEIDCALIIKPSVDRSCGEGVVRFEKEGGVYRSKDGRVLDDEYMMSYGNDFVVQEALQQHTVLERLSPTALATIRLAVYRSVGDGEPHVTAAVLRVGAKGAVVDNIVAGGRFVGVDVATGRISTPFFARFGEQSNIWNDVDLSCEDVFIPSWDEVVQLAHRVAKSIPHHHLLALDITVTAQKKPMLIEYNIGGFSPYLFHFTGQTIFGWWTDEVVTYTRTASFSPTAASRS